MKKLPDGRLAHRLSPRRKGSHWTKLNKERCRDLERRGLIDGRAVSYEDSELDELTLAYAIHNQTVQKRNTRLKERLHQS